SDAGERQQPRCQRCWTAKHLRTARSTRTVRPPSQLLPSSLNLHPQGIDDLLSRPPICSDPRNIGDSITRRAREARTLKCRDLVWQLKAGSSGLNVLEVPLGVLQRDPQLITSSS